MVACCLYSTAQSKEERADKYFSEFEFDKAIELYEDLAAKKRRPPLHVIQRLADSYFNTNDYQAAKEWYVKLYEIEGKEVGEVNIIKLVQCLKASLENERADEVLRAYYTDEQRLNMILSQKKYLDSLLKVKEK